MSNATHAANFIQFYPEQVHNNNHKTGNKQRKTHESVRQKCTQEISQHTRKCIKFAAKNKERKLKIVNGNAAKRKIITANGTKTNNKRTFFKTL